jgi:hypothetical protein
MDLSSLVSKAPPLIFFLCISLLSAFVISVQAADSPLYGRWQMDAEKSDNVREVIEEFMRQNKPKGRRSGEGKREEASVAASAGLYPGSKGGTELVVSNYLPQVKLLTIEPVPDGIRMHYEGMEPRIISTSGETASISATGTPLDGNRNVAIAGWENDNFYSEITTEQGIHIFESYLVSGSMLIIKTELRYPVLEPLIVMRRFNRLPEP